MLDNQTVTKEDISIELSEFGILANSSDDLDFLLKTACQTVSHAVQTDMAKVLERVPEKENFLRVRATYGFRPDPAPKDISFAKGSAAGYALRTRKPVVVEDIRQETRFHLSEIEEEHGVQSMVNVVIPGPPGAPDYGVLEVDHPAPHPYKEKDIHFLQTYASFIAASIVRMKAKRDLEDSYKKLESFAHVVSHDLKEPARAIANYSDFLLEDYRTILDEEGQRRLQALKKLSLRMTDLITDLLRYSRAGKEEITTEEIDIGKIIEDVLEMLELKIKQERVSVKVSPGFPTIKCSRINMTEIFRNLIENGIKYNNNPEKKIEIGYLTGHEKNPNGYVFFVKDNGIGIPKEQRATVFEMFKRLHGRDEYGGGTGSGLAIVRKLVEQYNGDIWVEPNENEGSTFYFCLNCASQTH